MIRKYSSKNSAGGPDHGKEVVAEQALELRLLKKSMTEDGGDEA